MICNNCKTHFDLVTIDAGKSKFCRNCGSVLYKNLNGTIVFESGVPVVDNQFDLQKKADAERLRQEIVLKQRQLEIEQLKKVEADRIKQEQLLLQRQAEIDRENEKEAERQRFAKIEQQIEQEKQQQAEKLRQELLIKERQLELQRQREAEESRMAEIEKLKAIELEKQQQILLQKQAEQVRLDKELKELELKKQKELELEQLREKEQIIIEQTKKEIREEKENLTQHPKETDNEDNIQKSNWWKYLLVAMIALILGAGGYFLFDKFVLHKKDTSKTTANEIKPEVVQLLTAEKIKRDIINKEIIGWGKVENNDITSILTEKQARNDSAICTSTLSLVKNNVKSKAEVTVYYADTVAINITTNKITYQNTAPAMSWFNFTPVSNCDVFINTNENPVQLKTCENCEVIKLNTNTKTIHKLVTNPISIFISSDNKFDAVVDFIYIPKN
jgi:hypothetical protein